MYTGAPEVDSANSKDHKETVPQRSMMCTTLDPWAALMKA